MNDQEQHLTDLCRDLIVHTQQAQEIDQTLKDLRFLIMVNMKELGWDEFQVDDSLVQHMKMTSHSGYSSKMLGAILPNVIDALIEAGRADVVAKITKCYVTTHKSEHIRLTIDALKKGTVDE